MINQFEVTNATNVYRFLIKHLIADKSCRNTTFERETTKQLRLFLGGAPTEIVEMNLKKCLYVAYSNRMRRQGLTFSQKFVKILFVTMRLICSKAPCAGVKIFRIPIILQTPILPVVVQNCQNKLDEKI